MCFGLREGVSTGCLLARVGLDLGGQQTGGVLPSSRFPLCVGDDLDQAGPFVVDHLHRSFSRQPDDRALGIGGCCLEAAVGPVEQERVDELLPCLLEVVGDDVQHVRVAAAGHADVHPGCVQAPLRARCARSWW